MNRSAARAPLRAEGYRWDGDADPYREFQLSIGAAHVEAAKKKALAILAALAHTAIS
jgi:hypothetical protein